MRPVWPVHVHTLAGAAGAWFISTLKVGVRGVGYITLVNALAYRRNPNPILNTNPKRRR